MPSVTFEPFDPDLADRFTAAWREHAGDPRAVEAALRPDHPELSIVVWDDEWAVYRDRSSHPERETEPPAA